MVDVKVRLEVNPDSEIEKLGYLYVDNVNKVSNSSYKADSNGKYQNIENEESAGIEGLSFAKGYLVFNSDGYLANPDSKIGMLVSEQKPQEFVWGATDSNGYYDVTISFKNATNLDSVVFYGDKVSNQFPTIAYLDGSSYPISSDDSRLAIKFSEPSSEHSIRFTNWNRPNYNAVLTKITVMPRYWEIDKNTGLKSVESLSQSTGQPKSIFYGVVPSDGTLDILDIDGEIEEMVNSEVIPVSNLPFEIFINDTKVQSHISIDSDYNSQSKMLTISASNIFEQWQLIKNQKLKYSYNEITNLFGILMSALYNLGYRDDRLEMLDKKIIYGNRNSLNYGTVREYLERLKFKSGYFYTNANTVYDLINEICTISQLNLIQQDDGKLKFISARPIAHESETIISIPKKFQCEIPSVDIFLNNKYNNVKYIKSNIIESVEPILDVSYKIRNNDWEPGQNVFSLANIDGENVQLIQKDNNVYICFFKTVTSNAELIRLDSNIWGRFNQHPFVHGIVFAKGASVSESEGRAVGISKSDLLKEEYDFSTNITNMQSKCVQLTKYSTNTSETFAIIINLNPEDIMYAENIKIKLYGSVYNTSEEEMVVNNNSNIYEFSYTKGLLSDKINYEYGDNVIDMYDMISNNIIYDYSNGIRTVTTSVVCDNYYDTNGNLVIDWSNGDILKVGDIVQLDKDNVGTSILTYPNGEPMRFKITSRTFKKEGVPLVDLELQEVKLVRV